MFAFRVQGLGFRVWVKGLKRAADIATGAFRFMRNPPALPRISDADDDDDDDDDDDADDDDDGPDSLAMSWGSLWA